MAIAYRTELPGKSEFFHLFETTGWNTEYNLSEDALDRALRNSWHTLSAYDGESLVGFGRVICDGVVHALILDMIVLPEYRGKGIGSAILQRLVNRCRESGIRDVQLFCAMGKTGFYEKNGFERRAEDAPGMQIRNSCNPGVLHT